MEDVYDELERIYDRAQGKSGSIGDALYTCAGFFVDYEKLLDRSIQNTIRKYLYSKSSNTPPYKSIQDTPASFIEDFLIIHEEVNAISNLNNNQNLDNRKK